MSGPGRAILAAVLLCSGCGGNWVNLSKNAAFDEGSDDAVVVLKANPLATFTILPGWTDRNGWAVVATLGDKYQINPVDGYIVLKLAPRSGQASYGIVRVRPANDSSPMFAKGYSVVRGRELPTFHAIRGQVTYVGALSFEESGDDLRLSIEPDTGSDDVRMVAQYMARTYPKVRAKVAVDALRMVARTDGPSD